MNIICRLCLRQSNETMKEIKNDCELYNNIFKCFSYQLNLENHLPKVICTACCNKIEDIVSFRERIIENQMILLNKSTSICEKDFNEDLDIENCSTSNDILNSDVIISTLDHKEVSPSSKNGIKEEIPELKTMEPIIISNKFLKKEPLNTESTPNLCLMCFKSFPTRQLLLKHYLTDETKDSMPEGDLDVKVGIKNEIYTCKECKKQFKNKSMIMKHISIIHNNSQRFICKICGKMFRKAVGIVNHGKSHSNFKFSCSFKCGYSSGYAHVLKCHEKTHRKEYKYTCQECGKGFQAKTWYEQHQNIHKGIKEFVCNICGAGFHMDRYLTSHKQSVHPESFTKKRYICVYCSLEYGSKRNLNLHLQEHGIKSEFLCDNCGKVMKSSRQLSAHKLQHTTKRPFVCGKCNKTFAKKYNWQIHQRTHTNYTNENKQYECITCMKTFTQQSALNRHKRSKHSKE